MVVLQYVWKKRHLCLGPGILHSVVICYVHQGRDAQTTSDFLSHKSLRTLASLNVNGEFEETQAFDVCGEM